jgi:RNA polymerase sigma-70 factor (ECF subfamily)
MLRDDDRAQDCVQQCYLRLWEHWDTIDTTLDILPLLYTYARNITIDHLRRSTRIVSMDDLTQLAEQLSDGCSTHAYMGQKEAIQTLEELLDRLPPRRRQVFRLIKLEGHSYQEVASQLQISKSTVEKHMHEAYKFFAKEKVISIAVLILLMHGNK